MAVFRYIGSLTKANGKIDVIVPKADGTKVKFADVTPDTGSIDVGDDEISIAALENSVDLMGQYNYERVS